MFVKSDREEGRLDLFGEKGMPVAEMQPKPRVPTRRAL